MFEIIKAGGWMMLPIIGCSVVSLAIILERFWALRTQKIVPSNLAPQVWNMYRKHQIDGLKLREIQAGSPLGEVLASALANFAHGREAMRDSVEQVGRQVVHEMERYLNTLGTIASVSPYLGLLGSVLGMIKVFSTFSTDGGIANPSRLAGGISEILIATAAGLAVAIPSLIFYRFFQGRVTELAVRLEDEANQMVDALLGLRGEDSNA